MVYFGHSAERSGQAPCPTLDHFDAGAYCPTTQAHPSTLETLDGIGFTGRADHHSERRKCLLTHTNFRTIVFVDFSSEATTLGNRSLEQPPSKLGIPICLNPKTHQQEMQYEPGIGTPRRHTNPVRVGWIMSSVVDRLMVRSRS